MNQTNKLYSHRAALRTNALLHEVVMGYRPWGQLHVEAFWERYPECDRDPRRLDAVGKEAYANMLALLRARLQCAIRDARLLRAMRAQCELDNSDVPEVDPAVLAELDRMQQAEDDGRREIREEAALEEEYRAVRAAEDEFDAQVEYARECMRCSIEGDVRPDPADWGIAEERPNGNGEDDE
jgi:hypothetical protein